MDGKAVGGVYGLENVLIVGGLLDSIDAVSEYVGFMGSWTKEGEVDGEVARCPVGHGCQIPGRAFAAGDKRVGAQLSVEGNGFIERCGNLGYKVGTRLVLHVFCWTVCQHL